MKQSYIAIAGMLAACTSLSKFIEMRACTDYASVVLTLFSNRHHSMVRGKINHHK